MTSLAERVEREAAAEREAAWLAADPAGAARLRADMAAQETQSQATDPEGARAQARADLEAWQAGRAVWAAPEAETEMEAG